MSLKLLGRQFISVKYLCYLCLTFRYRVPKSGCGKFPFHRIPGDKGRRKDSIENFHLKIATHSYLGIIDPGGDEGDYCN